MEFSSLDLQVDLHISGHFGLGFVQQVHNKGHIEHNLVFTCYLFYLLKINVQTNEQLDPFFLV